MSKTTGRVCLLLVCAMQAAFADSILVSGNSMNGNSTLTNNLAELTGDTFTVVAPVNFASTDLSGFSAIWLDGFSEFNDLSGLSSFLAAGGTVLVQNPGFGSEPL